MRNIKIFLLLLFIQAASLNVIHAQDKNPGDVQKIIEAKNYIFRAETVNPQIGGSRVLTSDYDLTITPDTIIAYLPYFGRAYTAPINPSEGGIKFTSTSFAYSATKRSKSWEITIRPKDADDVQQLFLDIYDNGNANLRVSSMNRQSISFTGHITEGKAAAKKAF
jgi:hypothetical protein